jgi:hypothetical protein
MSQGDKREAVIYPKGAHRGLLGITAAPDCTTQALTRSTGPHASLLSLQQPSRTS